MCGRFTTGYSQEELEREFELAVQSSTDEPAWTPRYNVAPSQQIPVVLGDAGVRTLASMRWGLVPSWADDPASGPRPINARAETAEHKPFFRGAVRRRRAIVPVDGWYEWQKTDGGKVPHWIHRADGRSLGLAALWEEWRPPEGEALRTVAIVTTAAAPRLREVHGRMPLVLSAAAREPWLDAEAAADDVRGVLARPDADELDALEWWPVSTRVNSPANDGAELVERVG